AEPNRSCLLVLRDIILAQDEAVIETRKWGVPCFCYKGKMFCFLSTDKKTTEPYLLLVEGRRLEHPALELGNRSRMKILRLDPHADLPIDTLAYVLTAALALYKTGVIKV